MAKIEYWVCDFCEVRIESNELRYKIIAELWAGNNPTTAVVLDREMCRECGKQRLNLKNGKEKDG